MSFHPAKRLRAPDGTRADIDVMLVPLIETLWKGGYDTIGCCQDLGESITNVERRAAYWKGYVLLEMPAADTCRLLDEIKGTAEFCDKMHWAAPGAWEVSLPVLPFMPFDTQGEDEAGISPWAQIHFPNDQVDDLVKVLGGE